MRWALCKLLPAIIRYTYVSCGGSRLPDTRGVTGKNI